MLLIFNYVTDIQSSVNQKHCIVSEPMLLVNV